MTKFFERYAMTQDIYKNAIQRLPVDLQEEHSRLRFERSAYFKRLIEAMRKEGMNDAIRLLLNYDEKTTACSALIADATFLYGALLMEKECKIMAENAFRSRHRRGGGR